MRAVFDVGQSGAAEIDDGLAASPPEQLLHALLLPVLYTGRSERLLMEEVDYNLLCRVRRG